MQVEFVIWKSDLSIEKWEWYLQRKQEDKRRLTFSFVLLHCALSKGILYWLGFLQLSSPLGQKCDIQKHAFNGGEAVQDHRWKGTCPNFFRTAPVFVWLENPSTTSGFYRISQTFVCGARVCACAWCICRMEWNEIHLSLSLSIHLSVYLSICLSIYRQMYRIDVSIWFL